MAGTPVAVAAQAGLGTTPPSPAVSAYANDANGYVGFGSGTTPAAGAILKLTFVGWSGDDGVTWTGSGASVSGPTINVFPENAATAALGPFYVSARGSDGSITIACTNAPTASQAANTYLLGYIVSGGPS